MVVGYDNTGDNDLLNFICILSSFSANVNFAIVTSQSDTFKMNLLNKFDTWLLVSSKILQRFVCSSLNTSLAFFDGLNLKVSNAELARVLQWYWFCSDISFVYVKSF